MTATLNSIPVSPGERPEIEDYNFVGMPLSQPCMVVLQPSGVLDRGSSPAFQQTLEDSLAQVADTVIVDLLWVEAIDSCGIIALVAGIHRATALGKSLSFQSMDSQTHAALEAEWNCQRALSFGPWNDLFEQDLELFLDGEKLKA
jgi:anti-anti-sigma factor